MAELIKDVQTDLTADPYKIAAFIKQIQEDQNEGVSQETLMVGIYGYLNSVFSTNLQNDIIMASEFSNEAIPSRAKFERNIIAHALGMGVTDINAVPAEMEVQILLSEQDIINWAGVNTNDGSEKPWQFTLDSDNAIWFGDFEFHPDYDIVIRKIAIDTAGSDVKFAYTAQYKMDIDSPISNITNPYLAPPVRFKLNGMNMIIIRCLLRQVTRSVAYTKVLSDNTISSKTFTFSFEDQLAAFTIDVTENGNTTHMVPVYDGLLTNESNLKYPYFYYTYLDSNTIRVKFERTSYMPRMNADVQINLFTTKGEDGNFVLAEEMYPTDVISSTRLGYSNIPIMTQSLLEESLYGSNKKSIAELKKIIPKEALSRGSIINMTDLENYFNAITTDYVKMYIYKKRDNALERLYYSYMVMKNNRNQIIPTNTIDLKLYPSDLQLDDDSAKQIFKKGSLIVLPPEGGEATIIDPEKNPDLDPTIYDGSFIYTIPYNFIVSKKPLYGMYFMTVMDAKRTLDFTFINDQCLYQFICTHVSWQRPYLPENGNDTYTLTIQAAQNVFDDKGEFIFLDEETGEVIRCDLRCVALFYMPGENRVLRWAEAELAAYDEEQNKFTFQFQFTSHDYIDNENRIRIDTGLYDPGTVNESYAHFRHDMKCVIHFLTPQESTIGLNGLGEYVPNVDGLSVTNSYTVLEGLPFFYDYSEIVHSVITVERNEADLTQPHIYHVHDVPVVKYDYFKDEDRVNEFCNELVQRKVYIDYACQVLEDAFGINFKFFNTYGPARLFTLDNELELLNAVNISMTFRLKLKPNYDSSIIDYIMTDIKDYVEDISEIKSFHVPNLITEITNKYRESIVFFEFVDMNGYGPGVQHIYAMDMPKEVITPEFLNIATLSDGSPDITIILV